MVKDGSSWATPLASFWNALWSKGKLGDVWDSTDAQASFEKGDLSSKGGGSSVRVAFRNCTPLPLVLCWLNEHGVPHHYYKLPVRLPINLDGPITSLDHIETSATGHAFCLALCDNVEEAKKEGTLDGVIGGYRPNFASCEDGPGIHLVTVRPGKETTCCSPGKDYSLTVSMGEIDTTPIDTSKKYYEETSLAGWPVRLEKKWNGGDRKLRKLFEDHLRIASQCLPPHARDALRKNTPFWINKSQEYGPAACPTNGSGMCFHPESGWLEQNGMCKDKCECVEVYKVKEYKKDAKLWGPGGVLLHELCHAYHWKMLPGGYDNHDIKRCYELAMKEGLYDRVKVHGSQGPYARAYACENAMEYFAELSVAFLAGKDSCIEYNKWQPFNRQELKDFDPRAYKMLQRAWRVDCGDDFKRAP